MLDTLFTYVSGNEYQDVQGAWDWNLVPGTTFLLDSPILQCNRTQAQGNASFVGGASDGWVGTQAAEFVDPASKTLRYRKVRHFFDDGVLTTISNVQRGNASVPLISVLDQRRQADTGTFVDGSMLSPGHDTSAAWNLWHGGSGYLAYISPFNLTVTAGNRTGNWSSISTSTAGVSTVPIFSAHTTLPDILPEGGFSYATYPAVDPDYFAAIVSAPTMKPLELGANISAAFAPSRLSLVFWAANQTASLPLQLLRPNAAFTDNLTITVDSACIVLVTRPTEGDIQPNDVYVTVADPTQKLKNILVNLTISESRSRLRRANTKAASVQVTLPQGGYAGQSVQSIVQL